MPSTHAYGAVDVGPRTDKERTLCARAGSWDFLYLGGLLALDAGSVAANVLLRDGGSPAVRMFGPISIGIAWGATVSGTYLSAPKCREGLVRSAPPEGNVRTDWHLGVALALAGAAIAPIVTGITTGTLPLDWTTEERTTRIVVASVAGFGGALLPYLLPPRSFRAAKELERLRIEPSPLGGTMLSYRATF